MKRDPYRSQPKMTQFQRNLWNYSVYIPEMKTEIDLLILLKYALRISRISYITVSLPSFYS